MTGREARKEKIRNKATDMALAPVAWIAGSKVVLGFLIALLVVFFLFGWRALSSGVEAARGKLTAWGYLPDASYMGTLDGRPVRFTIDRGQTTADGLSWPLTVHFEGGGEDTYYLAFESGSLHLSRQAKSRRYKIHGNVVQKNGDGTFAVATREGKDPWLVFSPI